ncbi:MAG: hypothetical protein J6N53_11965 [Lachnospiraceae bacterium]|nr:hypothetical protein [Lachnospiraceae bacterium]
MKKRMIKLFSLFMCSMLTFSQFSTITAFAGEEENEKDSYGQENEQKEFTDIFYEKYNINDIECDVTEDVIYDEEENIDLVYADTEDEVRFEKVWVDSITETSAILCSTTNRGVYSYGVRIGEEADLSDCRDVCGNYVVPHDEHCWDLGEFADYGLSIDLKSGTKYYYQFYVKINEQEYCSDIYSFTTLGGTSVEMVPPSDLKWVAPGVYSFRIPVDQQDVCYEAEFYRDDKLIGFVAGGSEYFGEDEDYVYDVDGKVIKCHWESLFSKSGTYYLKMLVLDGDDEIYAEETPEIIWIEPEQSIVEPSNLHWEYYDSYYCAVAVCDPIDNAYEYHFTLYDGDEEIIAWDEKENQADFSWYIDPDDLSNHNYYFTVDRVTSNDLMKYGNYYSDYENPVKSPIYTGEDNVPTPTPTIEPKPVPAEKEQIMPTDLKWIAPGMYSFKLPCSSEDYIWVRIYRDGEEIYWSNTSIRSLYEEYGETIVEHCEEFFDYPGTYTLKVSLEDNNGEIYVEEAPTIKWKQPENRVQVPDNLHLHWEYRDSEYAIAVCDPIDNAQGYAFSLYEDKEYLGTWITAQSGENEIDFSWLFNTMDDPTKHNYYFTVDYVTSNDLTKYANSLYGENTEKSPRYKPGSNDSGDKEEKAVLRKENDIFVCYVNGLRDDNYSGYAKYENSRFYVENGSIKTDLNGVMIDPNSAPDYVWYFNANGQVQSQHVGLAEYDGEWFYIENGKVATDMNAFVQYDGGLFAVGAGRIISEYSGLMQDPEDPVYGDWYFFAGGQAQTQYTGLAQYDGKWFYVINGKLENEYTGYVEYDGAYFYVVEGMVQESSNQGTAIAAHIQATYSNANYEVYVPNGYEAKFPSANEIWLDRTVGFNWISVLGEMPGRPYYYLHPEEIDDTIQFDYSDYVLDNYEIGSIRGVTVYGAHEKYWDPEWDGYVEQLYIYFPYEDYYGGTDYITIKMDTDFVINNPDCLAKAARGFLCNEW